MSGSCNFRRSIQVTALTLFTVVVLLVMPVSAGFLYALNDDSGGSAIYGFRVNESTGTITLLPGFPVGPGNGGIGSIVSERMVADQANNRLYVVNDSSDTVATYSVSPATGAITPMPFSPISLGTGVWNTIAVHPSGSPLVIANNALNGVVQSFVITPTTATPAAGNPFPIGNTAGFSSRFSVDGNYYYAGGNQSNNIAGFNVNPSTGVLTTLAGSPFASGNVQPLAYSTDAAGRLYAVNSTNTEIRVFTSASGILTGVTGNPFTSGLSQRRFSVVHPNGNFLYVAGNTGNNVGAYQISGSGAATTIAAVTGSPYATGGTTANCLAINSAGTFLYVGNRISRNVTTFSVSTSTGQLTSLGVQPSNTLGTIGAINGIAYLPDAAPADIAGQVTGKNGGGLASVIMRLTSQDGTVSLTAKTNAFGFYRFNGILTGRTYTITPVAKGYAFSPPSIQITHSGEVTNANFAAQEN